jgi:hypothetical protein
MRELSLSAAVGRQPCEFSTPGGSESPASRGRTSGWHCGMLPQRTARRRAHVRKDLYPADPANIDTVPNGSTAPLNSDATLIHATARPMMASPLPRSREKRVDRRPRLASVNPTIRAIRVSSRERTRVGSPASRAGPRPLSPPETGVATKAIRSTPPMAALTAHTLTPTITLHNAERFSGETTNGALMSLTGILFLPDDRSS